MQRLVIRAHVDYDRGFDVAEGYAEQGQGGERANEAAASRTTGRKDGNLLGSQTCAGAVVAIAIRACRTSSIVLSSVEVPAVNPTTS